MIRKILNYIPAIIVPMITNFLLVYLYANYLTPEEYGVMNIYINTISLLYAGGLSFLQASAFRFYSSNNIINNDYQYMSTYVISSIFLTILFSVLMVVVNNIFFKFNYMIIGTSILVNSLYQFFLNVYRLEGNQKSYTIARILSSFATFIIFVLFIFTVKTINYSHPILSIYGAYALIVLFELIKRLKYVRFKFFSLTVFKKSLKYGIPMMGVSVIGLIVAYSDQYFILFYFGEKSVGYYSLGYRLADTIISNITLIILLVMTPILMRIFDDGKYNRSEKMLSSIINLNLWIIIPTVLFLMLYAENFIELLFHDYLGAEKIVRLVVLASFFHSLSMFTCKGLELIKRTKVMFVFLFIAGIINVMYNVIFLPIYGITAAAHSSILAYLVYNLLLIINSRKHIITITFDKGYVIKLIILNTLLIISAMFVKNIWIVENTLTLAAQIFFWGLVYLLVSILMGLLKKFDMYES